MGIIDYNSKRRLIWAENNRTRSVKSRRSAHLGIVASVGPSSRQQKMLVPTAELIGFLGYRGVLTLITNRFIIQDGYNSKTRR
jgi:hypothetical protein